MSAIFNSHSQRDEEIKDFFFRAFSGTSVIPVWQEYELEVSTAAVDVYIEQKIRTSSALFVLLSETVESLPFTRDWILWECGKADQKDTWVFEPYRSHGKISVVIPRFHHYVRYEMNDSWRHYINSIVRAYDDSSLLGWASAGAGLGAALNSEGRATGAVIGAVGAALLEKLRRAKAPTGRWVQCLRCSFSYNVHMSDNAGQFRCAKCNNIMGLIEQPVLSDFNQSHYSTSSW